MHICINAIVHAGPVNNIRTRRWPDNILATWLQQHRKLDPRGEPSHVFRSLRKLGPLILAIALLPWQFWDDLAIVCWVKYGNERLGHCPNIIEMFKLDVPSRSLRHSELLHIDHHRTYYGFRVFINRIFINANNACCLIDVGTIHLRLLNARYLASPCNFSLVVSLIPRYI